MDLGTNIISLRRQNVKVLLVYAQEGFSQGAGINIINNDITYIFKIK